MSVWTALLYLQGDHEAASEILGRAEPVSLDGVPAGEGSGGAAGSELADAACVHAWSAALAWRGGARDQAAALAAATVELAGLVDAGEALAAAYTVMAMVAAVDGDRDANLRYDALALEEAEAVRDLQQIARIRCNRGSHLTEQGDYARAVAELDEAVRLADECGSTPFRALGRSNRGEALVQLGRYDEAVADLEQARALFQWTGSPLELFPLTQLAEIHQIRGNNVLARAYYDDAIRIAETADDVQGLVAALAGLAVLLADSDPVTSHQLAQRAIALDGAVAHPRAIVAAGRAALANGDLDAAAAAAERATALGRERRDLRTLADAVELAAALEPDRQRSVALYEEAVAVWEQLGSPLGVARARLGLAEARDGPLSAALAQSAADALAVLRVRPLAGRARSLATSRRTSGARTVSLQLFGGFALWRSGERISAAAWRSTTARAVLAMLAIERGNPLHREIIIDRLWPDTADDKASNRLSVALSTIRRVVHGGEPLGDSPSVILALGDAVRLNLDMIDVDVERFFSYAAAGRQASADGDDDHALALYRLAEESYGGALYAEDPYCQWAAATRESAALTYGAIVRELAAADVTADDHEAASRRYLRLIEHDPFDEAAHLGAITSLVALGTYGQAHRLHSAYTARMNELGVDPAPFPAG